MRIRLSFMNDSTTGNAPSPAYRFYVLLLLTIVYTFNFIDRQIIGILSPAIKADLGLTDWQLGILKGFAFAVLYTTLGIPIARLADRKNRVTIIAVALSLWSGLTALSGACQNFTQLAIARVGVGIGEAGGSPPAHSLISDYFPKEKRAGALAFYAMGIPIGIAFAFLGGGWLTESFGWRTAFVVVGLPGIIVAILLKFTVQEQPRGNLDKNQTQQKLGEPSIGKPTGWATRCLKRGCELFPKGAGNLLFTEALQIWLAARHLMSIPTYRAVVIATTAASFSAYANSTWIVDFYDRTHSSFSLLKVYFALGVVSGTAYVAGVFFGGFLVDRLSIKNRSMYGFVPAIALLLNLPLFIALLWVEDPRLSLALQAPVQFALGFYLGPAFALAQTLAPISIRALSTAVFFFILNMIALGLGPTTAGFLSSALTQPFGEGPALQIALSIVSLSMIYGAWMFYIVGKRVNADWSLATGETMP